MLSGWEWQTAQDTYGKKTSGILFRVVIVKEAGISHCNCINIKHVFYREGLSIKWDIQPSEQMLLESKKIQPVAQSTENRGRTDLASLINLSCCNKNVKQLQCH